MNNRVALHLVLLTAMAMGICGCPAESPSPAPEVVRIGAVYPFTGPGAASAEDIRAGLELAADIVNGAVRMDLPPGRDPATAGQPGPTFKLLFRDSKGDEIEAIRQVGDLISNEDVAAVIGCYNSNVTAAASEQAEIMKTPFLNTTSTSPLLTLRGLKWFFRTTPDDAVFAANFFTFLSDLETKREGPLSRRLILLYENRLWGTSVAREEQRLAGANGFEVVSDVPYDAKAKDFSGEIVRVRKALPGIILQTSYAEDAVAILQGYRAAGIVPEAILGMNAGFISPLFLDTLGPDAEGVLSREVWSMDLGRKKPLAAAVNDRFRRRHGKDMTGNSARAFAGFRVLANAVARAGDRSSGRLRAALLRTDIPAEETIMPWGGIRFDPDTGQNTLGSGIIVQVQDGAYRTVWPWRLADRPVVWPLPWSSTPGDDR